MSKPDLSAAIQDYLKEIYKLEAEGTKPTTTAIAKRMGVAPSSATSMLKKLAALGLAEHSPYRGVELSESGRSIALEVIRHHRLLEQYLAETLGLPSMCTIYVELQAGPHTEKGLIVLMHANHHMAVVGGGGAYENVRGDATLEFTPGSSTLTLHLIP